MLPEKITLNQLFARHWLPSMLITAGCLALALLMTILWPKRYQSEMKFLVNNERADLTITPGRDQNTTTPSEVSETEVNSEIELLRSHDILRDVVLSQRLYVPFQRDRTAEPDRKSVERASQRLERALSVSAMKKTNIIDVTYQAGDPDVAVAVLKKVSDQYLAAHLLAHSASGTDEFFSGQVKRYQDELTRADRQLAQFRNSKQLFALPQQQTELVTRFQDASSQLRQVEAQIHVQESRLHEGTAQMEHVPERVTTQVKQVSDPFALQQLEPMLTQLENKRVELLMKVKPTDRLVTEVDNEIANTQRDIAAIRTSRMDENTTDLNALHQSLQGSLTQTAIDLKGLQRQRLEWQQMRDGYARQLSNLDDANITLQHLEQEKKEAEDNYELYVHHLGEARLSAALDHDKFSNVVVIEKPVSSYIPVAPKPLLNLTAGALLGLMLSVGVAFALEARRVTEYRSSNLTGTRSPYMPNTPISVASGD